MSTLSAHTLDGAWGPNYRRYELPWSQHTEERQRLKKILKAVMVTLLVLSVVIPFLPVSERDRNAAPDVPPRLAKLLIEKKLPPPPPPPVVELEIPDTPKSEPVVKQPEPVKPVIKPEPIRQAVIIPDVKPPEPTPEQIREKAKEKAKRSGLLAVADDLAALRQNDAINKTSGRALSAAVENSNVTERSLITSKSSKRSAGVNTAALSRNTGGGGLATHTTTAVSAPVSALASNSRSGSEGSTSVGNTSGAGQRSQQEIESIFDRNKAAIYALYRRALRKDPTLQGKLVLQLTIAPSGKVVSCAIVSSDLSSPEFEANLVKRVSKFDFGAQDVDEVTTTKPIDFFPA